MAKGERIDLKTLFAIHIIRPGLEPKTIYCPPGSQAYLVCPADRPLNPKITMDNIVALTDGLKIITRGTEGQFIIMLAAEKTHHNKHKINMAIGLNPSKNPS